MKALSIRIQYWADSSRAYSKLRAFNIGKTKYVLLNIKRCTCEFFVNAKYKIAVVHMGIGLEGERLPSAF